jgi:GNAT superfamily N-acetyltransferase
MTTEPVAALLQDVAAGKYPPPDGGVTILPQPSPRDAGVLDFTAHAVIVTDADPDWVRAQLPEDDLGAPLRPDFLQALGARTGRQAHSIDMVCLAWPRPGPPALDLSPVRADRHPRVQRALRYRDDVRSWQADGGVVLLGRGMAGRWEVALEVDPGRRGQGLGRELALAARHLMPEADAPLWAQISPGNAASVRAFLAAGYQPVGSEALLTVAPATEWS